MPKTVIAIPARDEAERISGCLRAIEQQERLPDHVLLMLNNCRDSTEDIARALAPRLRFSLDIVSVELPAEKCGAGHARRLAMDAAATLAGPEGLLLTTDADAVVPQDWVRRNVEWIHKGIDLVCGRAIIDPFEAAAIPQHLHADDEFECRLIALLDDIAWLLDPEPYDPPLRHTEASGASLAVTLPAYRRVGGIPDLAAGEDRAFARALWLADAKLRHDPAVWVAVSGRIVGRALGGMADTIRRRMVQQDEFTDEQVEPAADAFRRYHLRRRYRDLRRGRPDNTLAVALHVEAASLTKAVALPTFGQGWALLEATSRVLRRRRVRFKDLPFEITAAESWRRVAEQPGRASCKGPRDRSWAANCQARQGPCGSNGVKPLRMADR